MSEPCLTNLAAEIESRQDELLRLLDELNERVELALTELVGGRVTVAIPAAKSAARAA